MAHVPNHLREAFLALVYNDDPAMYAACFDFEPPSERDLMQRLVNCSDIMPRDACNELGLPQGSTYSMGVGAYLSTKSLEGTA